MKLICKFCKNFPPKIAKKWLFLALRMGGKGSRWGENPKIGPMGGAPHAPHRGKPCRDITEIIFFRKPGQKSPNITVKLNGHRLYPSNYIKYLGVYIDEHLNGRFHCNLLLNKLKCANGMLSKARHLISLTHLKMLYFAIFSSHLTYGCQQQQQQQQQKFFFKIQQ